MFISFSLLLLSVIVLFEIGSSKTIIVDDDGGADYIQIQDAINASDDGDTIFVWDGKHLGNITINKSISLIGNGSDVSTIDGEGSPIVINITADWVNVSGFTLTNTSGYFPNSEFGIGIFLHSNNVTVSQINCSDMFAGIHINNSHNNRISYNIFSQISLNYSNYNTLFNNSGNRITIYRANNNTLSHNTYNRNNRSSISVSYSDNNIISFNTCINNRNHGIYLWESSRNRIMNNYCSQNENGIYLYSSPNNSIISNDCYNNEVGIRTLKKSHSNEIANNRCHDNQDGIIIENGDKSVLYNNSCYNNRYGIKNYDFAVNTSNNITISENDCRAQSSFLVI